MGQSGSKEEGTIVKLLLHTLSKKGIKCDEPTLWRLLLWCRKKGFAADPQNSLDVGMWGEVGKVLWDAVINKDKDTEGLLKVWKLVFTTLQEMEGEEDSVATRALSPKLPAKVKMESPPNPSAAPSSALMEEEDGEGGGKAQRDKMEMEKEPELLCPRPPPSMSPLATDGPPREAPPDSKIVGWVLEVLKKLEQLERNVRKLEQCKKDEEEALNCERRRRLRDEDEMGGGGGADPRLRWKDVFKNALLAGQVLPMPTSFKLAGNFRGKEQPNLWAPFEWEIINGARESITQNGLNSDLTQSFLDYIFTFYSLTPQDSQILTSLILPSLQQLLWKSHWHEACSAAAAENSRFARGSPLSLATAEMLTGQGEFADVQRQAGLHPTILWQSQQLARDALKTLPKDGNTTPAFMKAKQGFSESYVEFVDRLSGMLEKAALIDEVKETLLKFLAVKNANPACKRILQALPASATIWDMVEAVAGVGSAEGNAVASAVVAAIKTFLQGSHNPKCHSCGKAGHLRAQCKSRKPKGKGKPSAGRGGFAGTCKRCQKFGHRARECHSKFRKDGSPLGQQNN